MRFSPLKMRIANGNSPLEITSEMAWKVKLSAWKFNSNSIQIFIKNPIEYQQRQKASMKQHKFLANCLGISCSHPSSSCVIPTNTNCFLFVENATNAPAYCTPIIIISIMRCLPVMIIMLLKRQINYNLVERSWKMGNAEKS